MTDQPDLPNEMIRLLDDDTVDAILAGEANGSVPAEYARLAELARAARVIAVGAEPATSEQDKEAELVAAIATAVRKGSAWNSSTQNVVPLRRRRRGRAAAAVAFAAITFSATAAAAATNHLPASLQDALSNAASHVGVHLPEADAHRDQPASTPPATGEVPQHDVTPASSASASDAAPPAVTPASSDGAPGNSAHDQNPGDIASEAHSDNPSSEDDAHARSGEDNGRTPTTQSDTTNSSSSDVGSSDHGGSSNSSHSNVSSGTTHAAP